MLLTGKSSCLDEPRWREMPFLSRGKTSLDGLVDRLADDVPTADAEEVGPTSFRCMMQMLRHIRRLQSPASSRQDKTEASRGILSDTNHVLSQNSTSLRMALQCVFAIHLVVLYTPCPTLQSQSDAMYHHWYSRVTL